MRRILTVVTIVSWVAVLILLSITNPGNISPAGMLGIFILGYVALLGAMSFLLYYGSIAIKFIFRDVLKVKIHTNLSLNRAYLYASVLATLPMMIISLHSAGGIVWYELFLVLLFGAIGVFYIARRA